MGGYRSSSSRSGSTRASARALARQAGFDIAATVNVLVGRDVRALRDALKPHVALYVGGMGSKEDNLHNTLVSQYGLGG